MHSNIFRIKVREKLPLYEPSWSAWAEKVKGVTNSPKKLTLPEKCPNTEFFPEKAPYLDTFHAVICFSDDLKWYLPVLCGSNSSLIIHSCINDSGNWIVTKR